MNDCDKIRHKYGINTECCSDCHIHESMFVMDDHVDHGERVNVCCTIRKEIIKKETGRDDTGVHETHCCERHGCKYGDHHCPVEEGKVKQWYPCKQCVWDEEELNGFALRLSCVKVNRNTVTIYDEYTKKNFEIPFKLK